MESVTKERSNLFDALRVLLTVSVVVSHASGTIYHGEIVSANVAVDGFFMLSGLFMAKHLHERKSERPEKTFLDYQLCRIKRLFPMYAISCACGLAFDALFFHKISLEKWSALYFLGDINGIPGFSVTWYVAALFWAGLLVSAFLVWRRKISVLVIFPLVFFVLFSVMYSYHNLWLYAQPLVGGIFSAGLLKAVCALCAGAEVFYVSLWLKSHARRINPFARRTIAVLCEVLFLYGFSSSFWIWFSPKNFFVYLYVPLILIVFLLDEQVIFRIFDKKRFASLGKTTYAVYLTHLYFIQFLAKTGVCLRFPSAATYFALVPATFLIGWIFCKIETIFLVALKKLFSPNVEFCEILHK